MNARITFPEFFMVGDPLSVTPKANSIQRRADFPLEENTNHPRLHTAQTVLMP
jgi:hypothetical protein